MNKPSLMPRLSQPTRRPSVWLIRSIPFMVLLLMTSCANQPVSTAIAGDCGHRAKFIPDPGWTMRLTEGEKQQVVKINEAIDDDCGAK